MPYKDKEREKEYKRTYRQEHQETINDYWKTDEYKKKKKGYDKTYNQTHKIKKKEQHQKWWKQFAYNLSLDDFNDLLESQNHRCAICGKAFVHTPFVDHDHATGQVRGLLCRHCNVILGMAGDSCEILKNAFNYLSIYKSDI